MSYKTSTKDAISKRILDIVRERGYTITEFYDMFMDKLYLDYPDKYIELSYEAFRKQVYGINNPGRPEYYIVYAEILNVSLDYLMNGVSGYVVKDSFTAEPTAKGIYRAIAYIYRALSSNALRPDYAYTPDYETDPVTGEIFQNGTFRNIGLLFSNYHLEEFIAELKRITDSDLKRYDGRNNLYDDKAILAAEGKELILGNVFSEEDFNSTFGHYQLKNTKPVKFNPEEGDWIEYALMAVDLE